MGPGATALLYSDVGTVKATEDIKYTQQELCL